MVDQMLSNLTFNLGSSFGGYFFILNSNIYFLNLYLFCYILCGISVCLAAVDMSQLPQFPCVSGEIFMEYSSLSFLICIFNYFDYFFLLSYLFSFFMIPSILTLYTSKMLILHIGYILIPGNFTSLYSIKFFPYPVPFYGNSFC